MDKKIVTKNSFETKALGIKFAKKLKSGGVVLLFGDLGSGKTTFAQGVAWGLGIKDRILSTTFILVRSHKVKGDRIKKMNHIDLYRIEKQTEIAGLGLNEIIDEEGTITIIEWADKLLDFKQDKGYRIYFKHLNGNKREIKIKDYGKLG